MFAPRDMRYSTTASRCLKTAMYKSDIPSTWMLTLGRSAERVLTASRSPRRIAPIKGVASHSSSTTSSNKEPILTSSSVLASAAAVGASGTTTAWISALSASSFCRKSTTAIAGRSISKAALLIISIDILKNKDYRMEEHAKGG